MAGSIVVGKADGLGFVGPIWRVHALLDQAVECRVRPIGHACDEAVLHRIDVHVIHVRPIVRFVADYVFPVTALPDAALAASLADRGAAFRLR